MARVEQLFEMVERALEGGIPDGPAKEQVALEYAEFSRETRKRLTSAIDLARNGLRMELRSAVQERPPLVETADRFTSELALRWREHCKQRGIAVPAKITPAVLEELQLALAQAEDSDLDHMHRLYRRQNLSRASVYDRLQTLRRISRRDPESAVWTADLPLFEAEALREMRGRFAEAVKTGQLDDASEVIQILSSDDWQSRDAGKLAVRSQGELRTAVAKQAKDRASECARDLYSSYMEESVPKVAEQLELWNALCQQMADGGLEPPKGSVITVMPIIEWYESRQQQARVEAETRARLAGLERAAIDTKASADEIQAQLIAAEQMPGGVPEDLRSMAERRVREHTAGVKVRRTVRFAAIGVACAAVLATAVWLVVGVLRAEEESVFAEAVAAAAGRGDAREVERLVTQARDAKNGLDQLPSVLTSLELLAANQRIDAERAAEFDRQVAAAGDPASAQPDSPAIEAAAKLAQTDEQRQRIAQWREAQVAGAARSQAARDAAFLEQVKALAREIDDAATLPIADPSTDRDVKRVELLAAQLGGTTGVGRDARVAFDIQRRRLAAVRDSVDHEAAQVRQATAHRESVADVVAAAMDPAKLGPALEAFADDHPDSHYATPFREAAASASQWGPVLGWLPIAARISRDPFPLATPDRTARRTEIEKFSKQHPGCAIADDLTAYSRMLADGSGWTQWLANIIKTWPPMQMNMVELDSGERYYSLSGEEIKPTTTPGVDLLRVMMSWTDEKTAPVRIERKRIKRSGPSPQAVLGEALLPLVKGSTAKPTGEGGLEALKMIRDDAAVDPLARAYLISGLLPELQAAVPGLRVQVQRAIDLLKEEDLEGVDWLAPGIPAKRRDFKTMTDLLGSAIPIVDWQREYRAQMAAVQTWLRGTLQSVGILDTTNAPFTVLLSGVDTVQTGDSLYAVVAEGAKAAILEVGDVGPQGTVRLNGTVKDLPSGTPIFAGHYGRAPSGGTR